MPIVLVCQPFDPAPRDLEQDYSKLVAPGETTVEGANSKDDEKEESRRATRVEGREMEKGQQWIAEVLEIVLKGKVVRILESKLDIQSDLNQEILPESGVRHGIAGAGDENSRKWTAKRGSGSDTDYDTRRPIAGKRL